MINQNKVLELKERIEVARLACSVYLRRLERFTEELEAHVPSKVVLEEEALITKGEAKLNKVISEISVLEDELMCAYKNDLLDSKKATPEDLLSAAIINSDEHGR